MATNSANVLGRLLSEAGVVDERQLEHALDEQRRTHERLGDILIRRGVESEHIARALAQQLRLPYMPAPLEPDDEALALVDHTIAVRLRVVPMRLYGQWLRVAMADPLDAGAIDDLRFQTGHPIEPAVAVPDAVESALTKAYGSDAVDDVLTRLPGGDDGGPPESGEPVADLRKASEAPPIVALVDLILERAVSLNASDIHIEPARGALRVRGRVDGVLREMMELPQRTGAAVVSRIKIMAGLDIAVKRRPQDGRTVVRAADRELSIRTSTLPADRGEKVVLRLLDPTDAGQPLDQLGLDVESRERLDHLLLRGHGVLLVTGPTGSGKTTTLYSILASLDRERRNVITLEDPIEYRLPGLTQVQVQPRAGFGFADALRSVLRQDPDVIMVGEMRDRETAEVGMTAALTGHLVLATLHTNDSPGAVARLIEMGAPPYLVAGGLIGVLAQRLARRVCPHCHTERPADEQELRALGLPVESVDVPVARGCARCDGSGYRGRIGLYELLTVNTDIQELILERSGASAIRNSARASGMRPLGYDAWKKVRDGTVSLEEVKPFLTLLADEAPSCLECGTLLQASFRTCPGCGITLRRSCESCGAALEDDWEWCAFCGQKNERVRIGEAAADSGGDGKGGKTKSSNNAKSDEPAGDTKSSGARTSGSKKKSAKQKAAD